MAQAKIDLDLYASLELEGVNASVYIGDADTPACEMNFEWVDLISNVFEMQCVPSGPLVYDEDNDGVEEIMCLVDQIRNAADVLEERARTSTVLLRDKWLEAGMPPDTGPFIVSFNEYLNYVVQGETDD